MSVAQSLALVLVASGWLFAPTALAQDDVDSADVLSQLRALTEEVRELQLWVLELESRLGRGDAEPIPESRPPDPWGVFQEPADVRLDITPLDLGSPAPLSFEIPPVERSPLEDRLRPNYDNGLYVFPGIDVSAATPADALWGRSLEQ